MGPTRLENPWGTTYFLYDGSRLLCKLNIAVALPIATNLFLRESVLIKL